MSTDVIAALNNFLSGGVVRLRPGQYYSGILQSVSQDNGLWLAEVLGDQIVVPEDIASELHVGERVIIANVAGRVRAGRRT